MFEDMCERLTEGEVSLLSLYQPIARDMSRECSVLKEVVNRSMAFSRSRQLSGPSRLMVSDLTVSGSVHIASDWMDRGKRVLDPINKRIDPMTALVWLGTLYADDRVRSC